MNKPPLYPLRFTSIFKSVMWGGSKIADYKSISIDRERVGESWEISGLKDHVSIVSNGYLKGRSLHTLLQERGIELLGKKNFDRFGQEFPLLIKFIDANDDLSIQVHPQDAMAATKHQQKGKSEMWYVIDAQKGAFLYTGFKESITQEEYVQRIEANSICDVLNKEYVQPGDVFFIPSGRVHSIGRGVFVAEIQQSSDITYRIWDYNRMDPQGQLRQLHIQEAAEALDYQTYHQYKTEYQLQKNVPVDLQKCSHFSVDLIEADQRIQIKGDEKESFVIWIALSGHGSFISQSGLCELLSQGETILFPASDPPLELHPQGDMKLLQVYIE